MPDPGPTPTPQGGSAGTPLPQVQKLPTGIEGFDDICHGGLPIGRSTLISGTSGTGKTVLSLNFLYNGIRQFNEPGIFVTFEESPLDILRNAASFGWNLQEMVEQDKLFLLDASPDPEGQDVAGSFDLSGLIERINYAIRKYKARRVAIDAAANARRLELILPPGFRPYNGPLPPRCSRRAATPTVRAQPQRPSNPTFSPRPNTPSSRRCAHRDG